MKAARFTSGILLQRIALDQPLADRARALEQIGTRRPAPRILVIVLPGQGLLPACPHPLEEAAHAALREVVTVLRAQRGHEHATTGARPQRAEAVSAFRHPYQRRDAVAAVH